MNSKFQLEISRVTLIVLHVTSKVQKKQPKNYVYSIQLVQKTIHRLHRCLPMLKCKFTKHRKKFLIDVRSFSSELAQQKENLDKRTNEFERATVAYELIKRSVDDPNLYKDVYAIEKRVETARQQVNSDSSILTNTITCVFSFHYLA